MIRLAKPSDLKKRGIVGMNHRNIVYIAQHNKRAYYPRVDDKLQTKLLAKEEEINTPELYYVVERQYQVNQLAKVLKQYDSFVIKPSKGSAGKGILVIVGKNGDKYVKASGQEISHEDVKRHVNNILSGLFSLGGQIDNAMVEALVNFTDAFDGFSFQGVPDVRVIVYEGYPVMAMMRLSTKVSDGKANLHQGAVGVGIDLVTGRAKSAVQFNRPVTHHPDTNKPLKELVVPHWNDVLLLASRCYEMTEMGYIGADIVLDKKLGPLILELNARPGLAIQVANDCGLLLRFREIEALPNRVRRKAQPEDRVQFSQKHFCD